MTCIWDTSYNKEWVNSPRTGRPGNILMAASTGLGQSLTEHGKHCLRRSHIISHVKDVKSTDKQNSIWGHAEWEMWKRSAGELFCRDLIQRICCPHNGLCIWKSPVTKMAVDHFACRHLSKGRIISRRGREEDIREVGGVRMGSGLEKVAEGLQTVKLQNRCCTDKKKRARAHRRQRHSSPSDNVWEVQAGHRCWSATD